MIRFLKHSEIDPEKWNQAIRNSLFSTVLADFETLNLLTGSDTWHALVQDDYDAVMPLPTRKKGVLKYVYTPFFMPQMGIFSRHTFDSSGTEAFLKEVSKHYVLADILLNVKSVPQFRDLSYNSYSLSLRPSYEVLYSGFSTNARRNIKTAEKNQCRVTCQEEVVSDIVNLFRLNRGLEGNVHYANRDYEMLKSVADHLSSHGLLEIYGVRTFADELAAGALFVKDGDRRWFWFSGRDNNMSECKPMFHIVNAYIREHSESDLILDFNGSNNPNVARFYKSFGAEPHIVPFVRRFRNGFWKKVLTPVLSR